MRMHHSVHTMVFVSLLAVTFFFSDLGQSQDASFACKTPGSADIVILVDGSWSIGLSNFRLVRLFIENFVNAFNVSSDKTRIGLAQYSGDPRTEWNLNTHDTKDSLIKAVRNLPYKGGNTLTGLALTYILENSFSPKSGARTDVPKIGILITDGQSQDDVSPPAKRLKDEGIEMFAIGVKNAYLKELEEIASEPDSDHVYNVADFNLMNLIVKSLTKTVCERLEEIDNTLKDAMFSCKTPADIVILVDGSWNVGRPDFEIVRLFIENFISAFDVGSNKTRIGLAQYSGDPRTEWNLNTHDTKDAMIDAVRIMPYKGGIAHTGTALKYMLENSFSLEAGARTDLPKFGILLTDGKSQDDIIVPAKSVKDAGINMFVIGVRNADLSKLKGIASEPHSEHIYNVTDFNIINSIVKSLTKTVYERTEDKDITLKDASFSCETPASTDIVILVDSSCSVGRPNFKLLCLFIVNFVSAFVIELKSL